MATEYPWPTRPLGNAGTWLSGGTPSKDNPDFWSGTLPWVSPKDMKAARIGDAIDHVSNAAVGNGTRLVPSDTLLMVVRGMILAHTFPVALTTSEVTFNQDIKALQAAREFLPDFLLYWLQSRAAEILKLTDVANHGTRRLPTERLFALETPTPPLPEQRKIAAILSAVDEVIEKTEAVIESLQALKKAMMQELLTRGLPGRHTRFKQTEIGEVPEGWEVARVEQIGAVAYGLTVNADRRESMVRRPYLTVANLQEDGFILDEVKEIGVLDNDGDRYECRAGDVLLVEGNANPARLGRSAVWRDELPGALHQNHLIRIRPDPVKVVPDWLSMFINASAGRIQIEAAAKTSSGLHTINSKVVGALRVALPSITEQRECVAQFSAIDAARSTEETCLAQVRAVKSALMSVLLSGELRVTPDKGEA